MKIRPATHDDIPAIVDMAFRFYAESGYQRIAPISKESAAGIALVTIQAGVMLVAEDDAGLHGMVCLHFEPYLFNVSVTIAHEIVWWVEPEARGGMTATRLLKAAEKACVDAGVAVIRMGALPVSPPQARAMLERLGYRSSETYFVKEIG